MSISKNLTDSNCPLPKKQIQVQVKLQKLGEQKSLFNVKAIQQMFQLKLLQFSLSTYKPFPEVKDWGTKKWRKIKAVVGVCIINFVVNHRNIQFRGRRCHKEPLKGLLLLITTVLNTSQKGLVNIEGDVCTQKETKRSRGYNILVVSIQRATSVPSFLMT